MHVAYNKPRTDLWNQSLESVRVVKDFFSDKDQEYKEMARRMVTYMTKSRMCLAARHRNRDYFEKMEKIIKTGKSMVRRMQFFATKVMFTRYRK